MKLQLSGVVAPAAKLPSPQMRNREGERERDAQREGGREGAREGKRGGGRDMERTETERH